MSDRIDQQPEAATPIEDTSGLLQDLHSRVDLNAAVALNEPSRLVPFLARYHHVLVCVHPFNNGNGRWSRLAVDAVLQRSAGQPPLNWATASVSLETRSDERDTYIAALRAADSGDFHPLIAYLEALNPGR